MKKIFFLLFLSNLILGSQLNGQDLKNANQHFLKQSSFSNQDSFSTSLSLPSNLDQKPIPFFVPDKHFNKNRFWGVFGTGNAAYISSLIVLNKFWYSDYEKAKFHFSKDGVNWMQMDKVGHAWTAYTETFYAYDLYRWAGLSKNKNLWLACVSATIYQGSIEVLDGHSAQWGASWGDLIANTSGVLLFGLQEALWEEQKVRIKFSSQKQDYRNLDMAIQNRVNLLYGSNFWENTLKDYNGQIYWLSFNPFQKLKAYPKWLNLAIGYGAENLFGAVENEWEIDGQPIDFTHIQRNRQFYLSFDLDLSKIPTKSPFLKWILNGINIVKFPAPALVLENGKLGVHSPFSF